jgi:hypothetical protein
LEVEHFKFFEKPVETELVKEQLSKVFDGSAEVKILEMIIN